MDTAIRQAIDDNWAIMRDIVELVSAYLLF